MVGFLSPNLVLIDNNRRIIIIQYSYLHYLQHYLTIRYSSSQVHESLNFSKDQLLINTRFYFLRSLRNRNKTKLTDH